MHLRTGNIEERILEAALKLLSERGYKGATTREIAAAAGVAEITLFRRFGSKAALLAEAVRLAGVEFDAAATPSGDLRGDLRQLAERYAEQLRRGGAAVFRMAAEAARYPELRRALQDALFPRFRGVAAFFEHYQERGELRRGEVTDLIYAFFGPIISAAMFQISLEPVPPLDVEAHVEGFLGGWRA